MYCPKCSQQQVSEEVRFCSRCGFLLTPVRELVARDSEAAEQGAIARANQLTRTQKGVRKGAWLMLASLAFTVFVGFLSVMDDDFAVLLFLPLLAFIVGFLRVLYGVFFAEKRAARLTAATAQQTAGKPATPPQLAAPRTMPIESFNKGTTAEMVSPPSVTENTTRLLEAESEPHSK